MMGGLACTKIGIVGDSDDLVVSNHGTTVLVGSIEELRSAWKGTLDGGGPK